MFSVVIPALNEEAYIAQALRSIPQDEESVEVVVVDGGSRDATRSIAADHAEVVEAPRGRARQMNAGAAATAGDVILFLHADTRLPANAFSAIRTVLRDPVVEGGAFRLRFDEDTPFLQVYSLFARLPLPQICFGDRALFVRRAVFDELGGFRDIPIFEDLEMVRLLHRRGGFAFLADYVTTSARRFIRIGPVRQQLRNACLWCCFMLGTEPENIAHHYPYEGGTRGVYPPNAR